MNSALSTRFLIVNADDFGLGPGINAGIARAVTEGILTSVSLMANGVACAEAIALASAWPRISIGVHLALVGGRPVSPPETVPSLVDRNGSFSSGYRELLGRFARGSIRLDEVYREWLAQARLLQEQGVRLTHLDSHQHLHVLPGLLGVALRVAAETGIGAMRAPVEQSGGRAVEGMLFRLLARRARERIRSAGLWCPDHFLGFATSGRLTTAVLARHLDRVAPGMTELMTHPGLEDAEARCYFPRPYAWEAEAAALIAPETRARIARLGIRLVPYVPKESR
jgi:hopanoid biosynthesis associated protein HpnK